MRITRKPLVLTTVCLISLLYMVNGNKSHQNEIPESVESARKFRSGRVHQVWEKANRMKLPSVTMTELYADLKHHDRLMMEHKHSRANGGDGDGLKEAELTEELHNIMTKYGMAEKESKLDKREEKYKKYYADKVFLKDPKLENLWKTAKKHGKFTGEEMESLELEFSHHRRKVEEFELLRSEDKEHEDLSDNAVEKQLKMEESNLRKEEMKSMYEDIQEGYQRLHLKTKQGISDGDSVPFTEPRVADLWEEAKRGNFTEEELESIKEELRHFQTRIEKHLFFKDQLRNAVKKVDFHANSETMGNEQLKKHDHLQNKVADLAAKVKKLHHDLTSRLSSGSKTHREL